ncbi:MAG: glycosyl transferase [Cyanobacteriota bacterium]|nr:glycosyl transferase [Cyanobacteriota bacterium]
MVIHSFRFTISLALSYLFIAAVLPELKRRLLDKPTARSSHIVPTPRGGGIAFVIVGSTLQVCLTDGMIRWIPFICLPLAIVGILDDQYDLSPAWRYFVQILTALGLLSMSNIIFPVWFIPILIIIITAIINFINFMDGLDGLLGGCSSLMMAAASAWDISGSIFGFLLWNWSPAKVFMGDVGSTFIGAVFAGFVLQQGSPQDALSLLFIGFPLFGDALICVLRRLVARENIFRPHRQHLYQRLNRAGWSHSGVASLYILAVFLLIMGRAIGGWNLLILLVLFEFLLGLVLDRKIAIKFEDS